MMKISMRKGSKKVKYPWMYLLEVRYLSDVTYILKLVNINLTQTVLLLNIKVYLHKGYKDMAHYFHQNAADMTLL